MVKPAFHKVTKEDTRGEQKGPGRCFYCNGTLGGEHDADCVIRQKTVVVKLTIEVCMQVPESWEAGQIEFHVNESSSCADNITDALSSIHWPSEGKRCPCGNLEAEFIREATEEDEADLGIIRHQEREAEA